jgi:hypothetical protein
MIENLSELICSQPRLVQLGIRKASQVRRICIVEDVVGGKIVRLDRLQYCECSGWIHFSELHCGFYAGQEESLNFKVAGEALAEGFHQFLCLLCFFPRAPEVVLLLTSLPPFASVTRAPEIKAFGES